MPPLAMSTDLLLGFLFKQMALESFYTVDDLERARTEFDPSLRLCL
jgi:hypothetical protein